MLLVFIPVKNRMFCAWQHWFSVLGTVSNGKQCVARLACLQEVTGNSHICIIAGLNQRVPDFFPVPLSGDHTKICASMSVPGIEGAGRLWPSAVTVPSYATVMSYTASRWSFMASMATCDAFILGVKTCFSTASPVIHKKTYFSQFQNSQFLNIVQLFYSQLLVCFCLWINLIKYLSFFYKHAPFI